MNPNQFISEIVTVTTSVVVSLAAVFFGPILLKWFEKRIEKDNAKALASQTNEHQDKLQDKRASLEIQSHATKKALEDERLALSECWDSMARAITAVSAIASPLRQWPVGVESLTPAQRAELQDAYGFTPGDMSVLNGQWSDDNVRRWAEAKMCQDAAKAIAAHGQIQRSKGVYLLMQIDEEFEALTRNLWDIFHTHDTGVSLNDRELMIQASVKHEDLLKTAIKSLRSRVQERLTHASYGPEDKPS